jgi:iron complex outermembrane receptor protein
VQNFVLGLKSDWLLGDVPARFNLALYHDRYDDLQAGIPTTGSADPDGDGNPANNPQSSTFFANVGTATVQGVEAELIVRPVKSLELSLSGTRIGKKLDSLSIVLPPTLPASAIASSGIAASAFYGAPDYSYAAGARYALPLPGDSGDVSFSVHYFGSSRVTYNSVIAPGARKLDLRIDWSDIMRSHFDVAVFATNVTNAAYPIAGALTAIGLGASSAIYNEPRMVGAQLRYKFGGT